MDATCYEIDVRYPTIQKLLWQSVHWLYKQLGNTCAVLGIKMIRSKYIKWKNVIKDLVKCEEKPNLKSELY